MQFPQNIRKEKPLKVANSSVGANILSVETKDPAEFELALRPWELMARPLAAGSFRHAVTMFRAQDYFVYREEFDLPMFTLGLSPRGMLGIGVPNDQSDASFWGMTVGKRFCPMIFSGPLEVSWKFPHSQNVAFINVNVLQKCVSEQEFEHLLKLGALRHAPVQPETRQRLARFLELVLKSSVNRPETSVKNEFQLAVQEGLCSILALIARQSMQKADLPSQPVRKRAVDLVCEFLSEVTTRNARMSELCSIAGMSERSLQYAFNEELGVSARNFMTMRRLHAVRRSLRISDPAAASVSEVAMEHGFFELGRFAGKYRACFDELPSETLKR